MTIEEFKAKGYLSEEEFRAGKRELVWSLWTEYKETMKRTDAYMRIATESKTGYTLVVQTITSKEKEATEEEEKTAEASPKDQREETASCPDCIVAKYPPCDKGIPCCKCEKKQTECNSWQPCPKNEGEEDAA